MIVCDSHYKIRWTKRYSFTAQSEFPWQRQLSNQGGEEVKKYSYLLVFFLPQSVHEGRWVTLSVEVHLHELLDGQPTGGRFPKFHQSAWKRNQRETSHPFFRFVPRTVRIRAVWRNPANLQPTTQVQETSAVRKRSSLTFFSGSARTLWRRRQFPWWCGEIRAFEQQQEGLKIEKRHNGVILGDIYMKYKVADAPLSGSNC